MSAPAMDQRVVGLGSAVDEYVGSCDARARIDWDPEDDTGYSSVVVVPAPGSEFRMEDFSRPVQRAIERHIDAKDRADTARAWEEHRADISAYNSSMRGVAA